MEERRAIQQQESEEHGGPGPAHEEARKAGVGDEGDDPESPGYKQRQRLKLAEAQRRQLKLQQVPKLMAEAQQVTDDAVVVSKERARGNGPWARLAGLAAKLDLA